LRILREGLFALIEVQAPHETLTRCVDSCPVHFDLVSQAGRLPVSGRKETPEFTVVQGGLYPWPDGHDTRAITFALTGLIRYENIAST